MMYIWQRYFLVRTLKMFFFVLGAVFAVYVAVDYSLQMNHFLRSGTISWRSMGVFYACHFVQRTSLLVPLSLLIATIHVLTSLNGRNEWLALQAAGMSVKKLLCPFLLLGALCTAWTVFNMEQLFPRALSSMEHFRFLYLKRPDPLMDKHRLRVLDICDGSKLAFQCYDPHTKTFHDLFWIRSPEDIWRIKAMQIDDVDASGVPLCYYVDHLRRQDGLGLVKSASYPAIRIHALKPGNYHLPSRATEVELSAECYSVSSLFTWMLSRTGPRGVPWEEIASQFYLKVSVSLLALLGVVGMAPWCVRFARFRNPLSLYGVGIFAMIACFVVLHAATILGVHRVVAPWATCTLPVITISLLIVPKFFRL